MFYGQGRLTPAALGSGMFVEEINLHGCPEVKSQTQHGPDGA